jgi:hypothetical protein
MKTNKKVLLMLIVTLFALSLSAQTIVKDVPIESDYPYLIKVWAYNDATTSWGWYEISKTGNGSGINWYIERTIKIEVDRYDIFDVLFIRGNSQCADTTRMKIHGSYDKHIVKDAKELRKIVDLDSEKKLYIFGKEIEKPKQ